MSTLLMTGLQSVQAAQKESVYLIKQNSLTLGTVDIVLSKTAFRWHSSKLDMTLFMHAPDWKILAYNDGNKKYLNLSRDEAIELFQNRRHRDNQPRETPIKMGSGDVVAGYPTVKYFYPHDRHIADEFAFAVTEASEQGAKFTAAQQQYVNAGSHQRRREYLVTKTIEIPNDLNAVFSDRVASKKSWLPLRMTQIGNNGIRTLLYDTVSIKKDSALPAIFEPPKGFTKAENKVALLINDAESEHFENASGDKKK